MKSLARTGFRGLDTGRPPCQKQTSGKAGKSVTKTRNHGAHERQSQPTTLGNGPPRPSLPSWTLERLGGQDLAGWLPKKQRGAALPLSEKGRRGQLSVDGGNPDSEGPIITEPGGVQRSGQGWEGTGHCHSHLANPEGGWKLGSIANTAGLVWGGVGTSHC